MHPERFAFIAIHDIMGWDENQMSQHLTAEGIPTTPGDILTITSSALYEAERDKLLELFRQASVKSAADILLTATSEAADYLRKAMKDFTLKPAQRLKAAIEILDHVPETSKTLRQYVSVYNQNSVTQEIADRMTERLNRAPKALEALENFQKDQSTFRANLKALIDVK